MEIKNSKLEKIIKIFLRSIFYLILIIIILIFIISSIFRIQSYNRETKNIEESAPSSGRFVDTSDARIFIQEAGVKGEKAVLLVHGTGAWSEIWRGTMNYLSENEVYSIALDIPPFGYSGKLNGPEKYSREKQANRIIETITAINISNLTLVCHSVGCMPTIEAVLKSSKNIEKLVLVDPALSLSVNSEGDSYFEQNNPSLIMKMFFGLKPLRNYLFASYGANPIFTKKMLSSFVSNKFSVTDSRIKMLQQPLVIRNMARSQADWLEYLIISKDYSQSTNFINYRNLNMSVFIIWGDKDEITPLWQGNELNKIIPNSRLRIILNAGHIPYIEEEEQFNKELLQILFDED